MQVLGQGAVHGAFAGYTGFTVGLVNTHYVYLPIPGALSANFSPLVSFTPNYHLSSFNHLFLCF